MAGPLRVTVELRNAAGTVNVTIGDAFVDWLPAHALPNGLGTASCAYGSPPRRAADNLACRRGLLGAAVESVTATCAAATGDCQRCLNSSAAAFGDCGYCLLPPEAALASGGGGCVLGPRFALDAPARCEAAGGQWLDQATRTDTCAGIGGPAAPCSPVFFPSSRQTYRPVGTVPPTVPAPVPTEGDEAVDVDLSAATEPAPPAKKGFFTPQMIIILASAGGGAVVLVATIVLVTVAVRHRHRHTYTHVFFPTQSTGTVP